MKIEVKKLAKRLVEFEGKTFDVFCGGGKTSICFHEAAINSVVVIDVSKIVRDSFFSPYELFYIN